MLPRAKTVVHFAEGVYAAHLVRLRRPRAVHAHFVDRAATLAMVMSRLLDVPYTVSIHAGADVFVNPVLLAEKIRHADHVVTCTRYNKTYIESLVGGRISRKIASVPHGLDLRRYEPAPRTEPDLPTVLAVGQLTERKGFALLIAACAALTQRGHRFTCRIVGRGPQAEDLRRMIAESNLDQVVSLCGAMPHERVLDEYRRATMFVLPCIRTSTGDVDGIPNVLAEAMALEVPVISSDLPAIRELVSPRVNGLLVPSGDVDALVAAMLDLLTDPDLRLRLGRHGRETIVRTFDVEANVQRFAELVWPGRLTEVST